MTGKSDIALMDRDVVIGIVELLYHFCIDITSIKIC